MRHQNTQPHNWCCNSVSQLMHRFIFYRTFYSSCLICSLSLQVVTETKLHTYTYVMETRTCHTNLREKHDIYTKTKWLDRSWICVWMPVSRQNNTYNPPKITSQCNWTAHTNTIFVRNTIECAGWITFRCNISFEWMNHWTYQLKTSCKKTFGVNGGRKEHTTARPQPE